MRTFIIVCSLVLTATAISAERPLQSQPIYVGSDLWIKTVTEPYNAQHIDATYKVYTHLFGFEDREPITKGEGGKYTHHRGIFLGWKKTIVDGKSYDTWSMKNSAQIHESWEEIRMGEEDAAQVQMLKWYGVDEETKEITKPFINEHRLIRMKKGADDLRILDITSYLDPLAENIEFRGDLHHGGLQVRMANEVSEHEDSTQYILPEGAEELKNDMVVGAWWVCASVVVRDKRVWVMHMTPPNHPDGVPVYSIRRYARFGAFWEPDLKKGETVKLMFRIALSENELDQNACQAIYDTYAAQFK